MQFTFHPSPLNNYSQWSFFNKAFSEDECEIIKSLFKNPEKATTGDGAESPIRKSEITWLNYDAETAWVYERISQFIFQCNGARYGYELTGFREPLQLGKYGQGDFYGYHQDNGPGDFSIRKLSVVIQLSDPEDYSGGALEFHGYNEQVSKNKGDLIIFPSFNTHQVTEITKGERFSLVAWISGPPFR